MILHGVREQPIHTKERLRNSPVLTTSHSSSFLSIIANYRPSLISSIKASPAFFCNEFCHSCEHSNITSSTTDWLCLKVINPAFSDDEYVIKLKFCCCCKLINWTGTTDLCLPATVLGRAIPTKFWTGREQSRP